MLILKLHGGFRACDADGREISIKSRKAKALLAYLASPLGKLRSREAITALLWSERGDEQARGSLRQALRGLRQDLGEEQSQALRVTNDGLALDPDRVSLVNASSGEEFLEGLHVNDPAFDEWLRDERLRMENETSTKTELHAPPSWHSDKPTIAVLPFQNLSEGVDQESFADGITVDVSTQLSRFRTISVISSWITSHFKGDFPTIEEVHDRLGVGYVATGSVRAASDRIRVSVQLLDAVTCQTVWAENFDRAMGDLFAVQDEITARIVSTIAGQLEERDRQLQTIGNEQDLTNYQNTLLAERCLRQGGKTETLKARSLFKKVVSAEPLNARAHSGLARTYLEELWSYWETGDQGVGPLGLQSALRAVELDPLDPKARINLGVAYLLVSSDFEKALIQFGKACELNRSDAEAFCFSGWCYALSGKVDPAIEATDVSIRLNPFDYHDCFHAKAIAAYLDNDYERCLDFLRNVTPSGFSASSPMLAAACHAKLGKMDKARDAISKFLHEARENIENYPGEEPAAWRNYWAKQYPFRDPADLERLLSALRLAGFPV